MDWGATFTPGMSLAEILVRSTVVFLALVALLRILPKRQVGTTSLSDLLFMVLVGGIAVEGLIKRVDSLTDVLLILVTIMAWSYALDWLAFRFPRVRRLIEEPPTCLIRDGVVLTENLRGEMISEEEIKAQLRAKDVDDPRMVKEAQLETNGTVSVVTERGESPGTRCPPTAPENERDARDPGAATDATHETTHHLVACGDGHLGDGPPPETDPPPEVEDERPSAEGDADDGPELRSFLEATRRLRAKLDWHERRAAQYRRTLAEHGVRVRRPRSARRNGPSRVEPEGSDSIRNGAENPR